MAHMCACAHMCARLCMRMRACVCVCVHLCMINENKHPFKDFFYLINHSHIIYSRIPFNFCQMELCFSVFVHK